MSLFSRQRNRLTLKLKEAAALSKFRGRLLTPEREKYILQTKDVATRVLAVIHWYLPRNRLRRETVELYHSEMEAQRPLAAVVSSVDSYRTRRDTARMLADEHLQLKYGLKSPEQLQAIQEQNTAHRESEKSAIIKEASGIFDTVWATALKAAGAKNIAEYRNIGAPGRRESEIILTEEEVAAVTAQADPSAMSRHPNGRFRSKSEFTS